MAVSVATCVSLGQSLRSGDAEAFLERYDRLLGTLDQQTAGMILTTVKEFARQISELAKDDFSLLESAFTQSNSHDNMVISTDEPVVVQLMSVLEELMCEGDSGAVSDVESSTPATELLSDGSSTLLVSECEQSKDELSKDTRDNDVIEEVSPSDVDTNCEQGMKTVSDSNDSSLSMPSGQETDAVSMPNGSTADIDSMSIDSKSSISSSGSFTTVRRRVRHRAVSSDQHSYTGPANLYHKRMNSKPSPQGAHSRGQRGPYRGRYSNKTDSKEQYSDKGQWTDRRQYNTRGHGRGQSKRGQHRGRGSRRGGRTEQVKPVENEPLDNITYNYYEVANYLLRGWLSYKRELSNTQ